mmetsp:Transcript_4270/g.9234  ORF Transcript_4270/g.9234 Transcript_4270/m.9234 type:complete len:221 (+) Transcript_4270:646-1308(+)
MSSSISFFSSLSLPSSMPSSSSASSSSSLLVSGCRCLAKASEQDGSPIFSSLYIETAFLFLLLVFRRGCTFVPSSPRRFLRFCRCFGSCSGSCLLGVCTASSSGAAAGCVPIRAFRSCSGSGSCSCSGFCLLGVCTSFLGGAAAGCVRLSASVFCSGFRSCCCCSLGFWAAASDGAAGSARLRASVICSGCCSFCCCLLGFVASSDGGAVVVACTRTVVF